MHHHHVGISINHLAACTQHSTQQQVIMAGGDVCQYAEQQVLYHKDGDAEMTLTLPTVHTKVIIDCPNDPLLTTESLPPMSTVRLLPADA